MASSFENGGAWVGSFVFTSVFVGIGFLCHLGREKETDTLAQMNQKQALLRSLQPGFQWGSEMFLMSGVDYSEPSLAAGMALFRISHAFLAIILMICIFDWMELGPKFDPLIDDVSKLKNRYNHKFADANKCLVVMVFILSLLDVTMIQHLPWKAPNDLYQETQGFPQLSVMQWCLGVKIVQSFVSICSQIAFLGAKQNSDDPAMSSQGVALFVMNILCSAGGIIASVLMLVMKDKILRKLDDRMKKEDSKPLTDFTGGRKSLNDVGSFGDVYGDSLEERGIDGMSFGANPMMSQSELEQGGVSASSTAGGPSISSTAAVAGDKEEDKGFGEISVKDDNDPFGADGNDDANSDAGDDEDDSEAAGKGGSPSNPEEPDNNGLA